MKQSRSRTCAAKRVARGVVATAAVFLLLTTTTPQLVANAQNQPDSRPYGVRPSETPTPTTCGLYLAMSSTSTAEETSWGIYTGRDLPAGAPIGPAEIGLVTHHLKANSYYASYSGDEDEEHTQAAEAFQLKTVDFLEELIWVAASAGAKYESDTGRSTAAIPGLGALAAFDAKGTNTDWDVLQTYSRRAWGEVPGLAHPGRGASSNFFSAGVRTTRPVTAGSELFMDYGENWSDEAQKDALTADDYKKLDETVDQILAFFEKHADSLTDPDNQLAVYQFLTRDVMQAAVGSAKAHKIQSIMPPRPADLHDIKRAGGMLRYSEPTVHRQLDWLEQHGLCMDLIEPGPSTIPGAGRGAFATRPIAAGGLVAPVPLIHLPDEHILDMHEITRSAQDGEYMRASDTVTGQQLLTNYVWGHAESTVVFLPVGPGANFINHASTGRKPNARMVWSSHPANERHLFNAEPEDLLSEENMHVALIMEIVATQDIAAGEEVLIDYGDDWEQAWQEHQREWKELQESGEIPTKWPIKALDVMEQHRTAVFKTAEELENEPYPKNVMLLTFISYDQDNNKHKGTAQDPMIWGPPAEGVSPYQQESLTEGCAILSRQSVAAESTKDDNSMPYAYRVECPGPREGSKTVIDSVPHEAFVFVDAPETSDEFFPYSFRHYIGIPDDVFPQGPWRNIATDDDDEEEVAEEF